MLYCNFHVILVVLCKKMLKKQIFLIFVYSYIVWSAIWPLIRVQDQSLLNSFARWWHRTSTKRGWSANTQRAREEGFNLTIQEEVELELFKCEEWWNVKIAIDLIKLDWYKYKLKTQLNSSLNGSKIPKWAWPYKWQYTVNKYIYKFIVFIKHL